MTTYVFKTDTARRHQVLKRGDHLLVDGAEVTVRVLDTNHFVAQACARPAHVRAVAHGDTVYMQLDGRACVIERVDPTRSGGAGGTASQGTAAAPMPGVVAPPYQQATHYW
ncbi:MAG: hypothetical protein RLZZ153_460 [Pseudomonadota bacterium]|jgi:hypothetical protein